MKDFTSRSLEGLILKTPVLTRSNKKRNGNSFSEKGKLVGDLVWGIWKYGGGLSSREMKAENGAGGGAWDKEVKEEETGDLGVILSFLNHLFVLVLNVILQRGKRKLPVVLGNFKITIIISPSSKKFWTIVVQFSFKKINFGDFKISLYYSISIF